MTTDRSDREVISRATASEHASLAHAMSALERALVAPYPGRESPWRTRVGRALAVVAGEVRRHAESAEQNGGLLPHIEATIGHGHQVTLAHRAHRDLVHESEGLLDDLTKRVEDPMLTVAEIRDRSMRLVTNLRRHKALEADLIWTAFEQDIGVGD